MKSTHAPLQSVYPLLHVTAHALATQEAVPWATPVEHAWPHEAQLSGFPVVSTHVPLQSVGVAAGHPDAHAYVPPEAAHTGVPPLHPRPQAPQLVALVSWTQAPLHSV